MKYVKLLLPVVALSIANIAVADEGVETEKAAESKALAFGLQASFGVGGDTVITDADVETLDAGDNFSFGGYVIKPELISDLSGKLAVNIISGSKSYSDAEEDLDRTSIDFLLIKEIDSFSFGAGLTYHLNPSHELATDNNGTKKVDYDSALGLILEATKTLDNGFTFGVQYTNIEYSGGKENSNDNSLVASLETVDASNIAFSVGYSF